MKKALLAVAVALLLASPSLAQPAAPAPEKAAAPAQPAVAPVPGGGATEAPPAPGGPAPGFGSSRSSGPRIERPYDEGADAKAAVAAAVAKAKKEKKRVLVTLGGNWCGWCRALDRLLTKDEKVSAALAKSYVPLNVDVGRMQKNLDLAASWGADPKKGVPLLVVLDGSGKAVTVQETGSLESGKGHDPEKVIAFLSKNAGR